ncbi:MAG: 50S ribosomal protein L35 [Planctomycetota bacterium]|nr:MAG: 50S ribosomal protein L35 [Planctomycetota bacterium]
MHKNKPHKGLLKRVKISKTGKVRHKSCGTGHLKSGKTPKRLRQLRKDTMIADNEIRRASRMLSRRLRGRTQPRSAITRSPSPAERPSAD